MLDRLKRRLSRTQSVAEAEPLDKCPKKNIPLSASVEDLITGLNVKEEDDFGNQRRKSKAQPKILPVTLEFNSERTIFNDVESGFLAVPTELLDFLQSYLTPSSEVALRHTCSRFFYLYSMPSFYLSGEEKFEFLCMTERDQDPGNLPRLVCGACHDIHPRSSFPTAQVRVKPLDRDCRQVWLCAHRSLGYDRTIKLIKAGAEAPFRASDHLPCNRCRERIRNRSIADRPDKGTSESALDSEYSQALLISKIALLQAPAPSYTSKTTNGAPSFKEVFAVKDVVAILQAIDFPICPHIKLGDPYVLSRFCRACINTQKLPSGVKGPPCIGSTKKDFGDPEYSKRCSQECYQTSCRTRFSFQAKESLTADASGKCQVWLIIAVYRYLGPLRNDSPGPLWTSHTVDHKERMQMRAKWDALTKDSKARRPMPNWSICLLNSEDHGLR